MRIAAAGVVLAWLIALSCYDVAERRLPNLLTLPGAAVILLTAWCAGRGWPAVAGAAAKAPRPIRVDMAAILIILNISLSFSQADAR